MPSQRTAKSKRPAHLKSVNGPGKICGLERLVQTMHLRKSPWASAQYARQQQEMAPMQVTLKE